jgi:hypothetical protein
MDRLTLTLRGPDGRPRTFVSAQDTTLAHDVWMMQHVHAAGLHQTQLSDPNAVLARALSSGRVFPLLAGSVVEPGVPWSAEAMDERAAFLASLTDPASKAQIHQALVHLLLSFFSIGTALSTTSPSSSPGPASPPSRGDDAGEGDPAPTVPVVQRAPPSIETAAVGTSSASGVPSSASSPAATPSG